jgi:hypothetical protein
MDVALQEVAVHTVPPSVTLPPDCVALKPAPVIVKLDPLAGVAVLTPEIVGDGAVVVKLTEVGMLESKLLF